MPDEYDPERTLGPAVAAVATLAGFPPDPEQRLLLDLAFALDKQGKSLAFEVVVIAPRQNLKTGFLKQYALGQLFVRKERLVAWSAHEFATAAEAVNDLEVLIDSSDVLRARVALTTRGNVAKRGAVPEIQLTPKWGKARMIFKTRTTGGARGLSGRKIMLDEAFALEAAQFGALTPIMLAQPDPQYVAASSACRPESAVLSDMVKRGRLGGQRRMVYAEWCAPPPEEACDAGEFCTHGREVIGCGCDKPELLMQAHSAVTRGRILVQSLVDFRSSMPPQEYGRELMGWHDVVAASAHIIDLSMWPVLEDPDAAMEKPLSFSVAVSPDRKWAAIGAAGRAVGTVGKLHLEVIDRQVGVDWVLDRCVELRDTHGSLPFVLDDHGPAASLIVELRAAGLNVAALDGSDLADATEQFVDGVQAQKYTHGPQVEIDDAILGVKPRPLGDRIVFGRKTSTVDITALEVLPFAVWGAAQGAPTVYSIRELIAQIQAEQAGAETQVGETPAVPGVIQRPDGSTFTPL